MGQIFFANIKKHFRSKSTLFWVFLFPVALGTLFNFAFSSIAETEKMKGIPVAAVCEEDVYGESLKTTLDALNGDMFSEVNYCNEEEALNLLENKEVVGILYSGKKVRLSVSASMTTDKLNQSILQAFTEEFNVKSDVMVNVMQNHPEKIIDVVDAMEVSGTYRMEVSLQNNTEVNSYTQYFYNLLAMACLYASVVGITVACGNQANISSLGARKNVSGTSKSKIILAELFAAIVFEFVVNLAAFCYLAFGLKCGVDAQLPLAILALLVGDITGVSLGYLIGSIGTASQEKKWSISFVVTMPCCFLSGLMIGGMRVLIDEVAPFINHINPAALIADSFYSLSIYEGYNRYLQNIFSLLGLSALFLAIGLFLTRRNKYASL